MNSEMSSQHCSNCGVAEDRHELSYCHNEHFVCEDCLLSCQTCEKLLCVYCSVNKCPVCEKLVCDDCLIECISCGKSICSDHIDIICQECHIVLCSTCYVTCQKCGKELCNKHAEVQNHECVDSTSQGSDNES